ncbi:MAG: hypothetical protein IT336_03640 [Thermomicrobiales bacterium]|nr:hypothetical protein [Thermomicrobiales bacterium]
MRSTTPSKSKSRTTQRRSDQAAVRANRAQVRAMEARSVSTTPDALVRPSDLDESVVATGGAAALTRRRPIARPKVLSRAEEYAYIKADMRRLVITAAVLFIVMIALLIVLD